jgi:predicted sulfurtransferase
MYFRESIRLFCRKSIVGRILMPTNGINNEEALEENAGFAGIRLLFD